jgi:choline kinase
MKLIVLAAGEGSRLRPYSDGLPKCMVPLRDGSSLLERQLEIINTVGSFDISLIGGYCWEKLLKYDLPIIINKDYKTTNMVWSLFCAREQLNDDLIISYGDIVYSKYLLNDLLKSNSDISIAIDKNWESYWRERNDDPLDDAESLKILGKDRIIEIGKKAHSVKEIQGQYMGLMKFNKTGLSILTEVYEKILCGRYIVGNRAPSKIYMTDLLQAAIDMGYEVNAIYNNDPWVEVDTVRDLMSDITNTRLENIKRGLD